MGHVPSKLAGRNFIDSANSALMTLIYKQYRLKSLRVFQLLMLLRMPLVPPPPIHLSLQWLLLLDRVDVASHHPVSAEDTVTAADPSGSVDALAVQ